jgi:hypothetical protein
LACAIFFIFNSIVFYTQPKKLHRHLMQQIRATETIFKH